MSCSIDNNKYTNLLFTIIIPVFDKRQYKNNYQIFKHYSCWDYLSKWFLLILRTKKEYTLLWKRVKERQGNHFCLNSRSSCGLTGLPLRTTYPISPYR